MPIANSICTKDTTLNILTGNVGLNIGSDAFSKAVTIGSSSINSGSINFETGTGTINIGTGTTALVTIGNTSGSGIVNLDSGTGAINIGTSVNKSIFIGTTGSSNSLIINSGTGAINIGTAGAKTITIGNGTGATTVNINSGTGAINIGTSIAKTITIGATTGSSEMIINAGTGGISLRSISQVGTSFNFVPGINHIANNGSLVTGTLPATVAVGSIFIISGYGAGGWRIAQNASQVIHSTAASTTPGTGGSLSSGGRYDSVRIICITANTTFVIMNYTGTLTFV